MERNNFIRKTLIFVLLLATSFLVVGKIPKTYAFVTDQNTGKETDVIISRKATIDDNFAEDALIITLTQDTIFDFRQYTTLDFPELNLANVTEITDELYSRVEQQIKNDANGIFNNTESRIDVDSFRRIFKLELLEHSKENVLKAIELLEKRDDIRSAEPNYIGEFSTLSPNDPARIDQWALNYLQLPNAWYLSTGSATVRVGIADSGIDRNHPDLVGRINETLSRDHSGGGNPWFTTNVHGTHVAGIVGATGNNSLGISGVNWNVELVSLKVGNQGPTAAAVAAAITFARVNGIRVLNLSLNINETQAINDAINAFDGVIVCAAGNNTSETVGYPARVNNPRIISVGSLDSDNSRSSFSNWGKVEIWAPGGNILSTIPEGATPEFYRRYSNGYAYTDGTSMAAPHVAGVAALMLSVNPNLTPQQLQTNIINNANTITITVPDPGFWPWEWNRTRDIVVQRLNAYEAVKSVAIFNTRILANDTIEIIDTFGRQITGIIKIPSILNNRPVKVISYSAFANQTQLTQITIPSSVTHIGSDAFKNTNNASIYLINRTKAPSTFNINWNSSVNPVYLNGTLCPHTSSVATVSLDDTHHGNLCNDCRTVFSKSLHRKYTSNGWQYCYDCSYTKNVGHSHSYTHTWLNLRQHQSSCSCGDTRVRPHIVSSDWNGIGYATCLDCGGPAELGLVMFGALPRMFESLSSIYIREYFGNDSFILSNEVIVLSYIDLEAYYNGTLVLPDTYDFDYHHNHDCVDCSNECIDCDADCHDCVECESYCRECVDCDDMDIYYDIRKTLYVPTNRKERDYFDNRAK